MKRKGFDDENPEWTFEEYDKDPGGDKEKRAIALLLFGRGQRKESRKMLESIEDEKYRWDCLHYDYTKWIMWEEGYVRDETRSPSRIRAVGRRPG